MNTIDINMVTKFDEYLQEMEKELSRQRVMIKDQENYIIGMNETFRENIEEIEHLKGILEDLERENESLIAENDFLRTQLGTIHESGHYWGSPV